MFFKVSFCFTRFLFEMNVLVPNMKSLPRRSRFPLKRRLNWFELQLYCLLISPCCVTYRVLQECSFYFSMKYHVTCTSNPFLYCLLQAQTQLVNVSTNNGGAQLPH